MLLKGIRFVVLSSKVYNVTQRCSRIKYPGGGGYGVGGCIFAIQPLQVMVYSIASFYISFFCVCVLLKFSEMVNMFHINTLTWYLAINV